MRLSDFEYELPPQLIAQYPPKRRGDSRLLILERKKQRIEHCSFREIGKYLTPNDILVLNDTKVLPARLRGRKEGTGGKVEVLLLGRPARLPVEKKTCSDRRTKEREEENNCWEVLVKPARRVRAGTRIIFKEGELEGEVTEERGERRVLRFNCKGSMGKVINEIGKVPLPPYIKRSAEGSDRQRYQTVYARTPGAVAAPTAGLHFTEGLLKNLKNKGVSIVRLSLHISLGTFQPVRNIPEHEIYPEYYEIPRETAETIRRAEGGRKRIVAVGTSTARALESLSLSAPESRASTIRGWTGLFILPGYQFKRVGALLTNFHLPKSSLLMLVSAFAGREKVLKVYSEAIARKYRFYSYGDAMLIT